MPRALEEAKSWDRARWKHLLKTVAKASLGRRKDNESRDRAKSEYPIPRGFWALEILARLAVTALFASYLWSFLRYATRVEGLNPFEFAILAQRIQDVQGGISPPVFLSIGALVGITWSTWHLVRIRRLRHEPAWDAAATTGFSQGLLLPFAKEAGADGEHELGARSPQGDSSKDIENRLALIPAAWRDAWQGALIGAADVRWRLFLLIPDLPSLAFLAFNTGMGFWLWQRFGPTVEAAGVGGYETEWSFLLRVTVLGTLVVTVWSTYRLLTTWAALRRSLAAIADGPLARAFDDLPQTLTRTTKLSLIAQLRPATFAQYSVRKRLELRDAWSAIQAQGVADPATSAPAWLVAWMGQLAAGGIWSVDPRESAASPTLVRDLQRAWLCIETARSGGWARATRQKGEEREGKPAPIEQWVEAAEDWLAIQFLEWVDWTLGHLRALAVFILVLLLLSTAVTSAYPFVPQSVAKVSLLVIVVAAAATFLLVLVQFDRDVLMSRISHTVPGKLNWNFTFVGNILIFIVLPLVAVLSSEFPALREVLFAWVSPMAQAFGGF